MKSGKDQERKIKDGRATGSPRPSQRGPLPSIKQVVAALIFKDDLLLVCQRTRHQTMPLKWEFPGGKIEEGEQPREALRRELNEELGIEANIGDEVARIRHEYKSGSAVELRFYAVRQYKGEIENRIFKDMRWAARGDLPSFDFLEADLQLVRELAEGKVA
ncbi:MAG: (deoxy)nucleoside triphosphate pyrophosphohydrolase [Terriglobales bacterium]